VSLGTSTVEGMTDSPEATAAPATQGPPKILGPERLKALSHPLRLRILDLLQTHGSLTASGLAELVGESSGSTSYHLRQLARHEFVREVEGKGTARERWWEQTPGGYRIAPEADDDVGTRTAKSMVNAQLERTRQAKIWHLLDVVDKAPDVDPRYLAWKDSITLSTTLLWATPEQLAAVIEAFHEFLDVHTAPLRGQENVAGTAPVQIHFNAFPVLDDGA
jgi:DNA-binding transcriptional ArsR family regulator